MPVSKKNTKSKHSPKSQESTGEINAVIWLYHDASSLKQAGFDDELMGVLRNRPEQKT